MGLVRGIWRSKQVALEKQRILGFLPENLGKVKRGSSKMSEVFSDSPGF